MGQYIEFSSFLILEISPFQASLNSNHPPNLSFEKMFSKYIFTASVLAFHGCRSAPPEKEEKNDSVKYYFEKYVEQEGSVVFNGWNGEGVKDGNHFRLRFLNNKSVTLDMLGVNFVNISGEYNFTSDELIEIRFMKSDLPKSSERGYTIDWPLLRLEKQSDYFLIYRDDGKTAWHLDWPLPNSVAENVWPARAQMN